MIVEPFKPEHLRDMRLQPHQAYLRELITPEYAQLLAEGEVARTIRIGEQLVACFGIAPVPAIGRVLWCFFSQGAKRHLVRLYRYARQLVAEREQPWLFATVEEGFRPGERLLRMLGFSLVDALEGYGPDQRDHLLFVRLGGQS
jgi:hypothetical protein